MHKRRSVRRRRRVQKIEGRREGEGKEGGWGQVRAEASFTTTTSVTVLFQEFKKFNILLVGEYVTQDIDFYVAMFEGTIRMRNYFEGSIRIPSSSIDLLSRIMIRNNVYGFLKMPGNKMTDKCPNLTWKHARVSNYLTAVSRIHFNRIRIQAYWHIRIHIEIQLFEDQKL